jgi:hypothetical protein
MLASMAQALTGAKWPAFSRGSMVIAERLPAFKVRGLAREGTRDPDGVPAAALGGLDISACLKALPLGH